MTLITEKKVIIELVERRKKERLDVYLCNSIENSTRTRIQKLIKAGLVKVNSKEVKASYILTSYDVIDVTIPLSPRPEKAEPEPIPLDIIFEDDDILIVNKPPGMVVHPAFSNYTGTLVNALLYHYQQKNQNTNLERAGMIHRIDKDTTGLLVIGKNEHSLSFIGKQFSKHSIEREYQALVWGKLQNEKGLIESEYGRSESDRKKFAVVKSGKYAATYYEVIKEYEFLSLVKLKLKTGRTHQIRVHLAHIGHPVFGDPTYGGRRANSIQLTSNLKQRINNLLDIMPRQALHAKTLGFIHPVSNEFVRFDSDLPEDMKELLKRIEQN